MKKLTLIYSAALILIALSITIFYSCRKEKSLLDAKSTNPMSMRTEWGGVSTAHGLLVFTNRAAFNKTLNLLMQDDTANHDTTTHYDPTESIIYNKILDAFEQQFSFASLRKDIEIREIAYLNGGSNGDEPRHHFIGDVYLQTLLNRNLEIQISDTIFRYVNQYRIILITNGDYTTLDHIRAHPFDYNHFPNVFEQGIYGKIIWSGGSGKLEGICSANFSIWQQANQTFNFIDQSDAAGSTITNWAWNFGDNSPIYSGGNPGIYKNPTHQYSGGSTHTVTLTITCLSGCTATYSYEILDCYAFFNYTQNGAQVDFIAANPGSQFYYSYSWTFGDGTGISGFQGINHIYTSTGTFHVCLTVTNLTTGCVSTVCQDVIIVIPVPMNCVYTAETTAGHIYGSSNNYKLDAKLWLRNDIVEHRVGAATWHYIKKSNGNWKDEKAHINDGVYGTFWDDACQNSHLTPISSALYDIHNGDNKSSLYQTWNNINVQISTNTIGIKYHSANSVHWISGTNWEIDLTLAQ